MKCEQVKRIIPSFLEEMLSEEEKSVISEHISKCLECQKEVELYKGSWELLVGLDESEPDPGYISRFWTKASLETSWAEGLMNNVKELFAAKRPAYKVATSLLVAVFVFVLSKSYISQKKEMNILLSLDRDQIQMIENLELVKDIDVIENLDLLENLELIEHMDAYGI